MKESGDKVVYGVEETLGILDEYKQKLSEAIEKEKGRLRKQAQQESASIIAEAEQKAKQIARNAIGEAEKESASILARARTPADQIISEALNFAKTITEAKRKIEQEVRRAKDELQREKIIIAEAMLKAEESISKVVGKVQHEFEESIRAITEAERRLEQTPKASGDETNKELKQQDRGSKPTAQPAQGKGKSVGTTGEKSRSPASPGVGEDELFVGTLELDIASVQGAAITERLQTSLSKIPALQVLSADDSKGRGTNLTVFATRPLPLLSILRELVLVKSVVVKDNSSIQIILEKSDRWIG